MCRENPLWGAPRIHGELLKLDIEIAESSVSKYMERSHKRPSHTWRTFLENHAQQLVSIDFFTEPTIHFQVLYVFLVLAHDRRRILHFNVTPPTQLQSGRDNKCARPFPSSSFRATCCATVMPFSVMISENSCEIWASARSCRHPARRGGGPMSSE